MDALSIIDRGPRTLDTATPTKATGKNEQKFGKQLNERQKAHESKPVEDQADDRQAKMSARSDEKKTVAHSHKAEMKQEKAGQTESSSNTVVESSIQAETTPHPQVKIQQTLVNLMQTIKTVAEDDSADKSEGLDRIQKLLTDLAQQLETTEPADEQLVAGLDLSSLATKLEAPNKDADHKKLLAQLVTAITEQLTNKSGLLKNGELAATLAVAPQQNRPSLWKNHPSQWKNRPRRSIHALPGYSNHGQNYGQGKKTNRQRDKLHYIIPSSRRS